MPINLVYTDQAPAWDFTEILHTWICAWILQFGKFYPFPCCIVDIAVGNIPPEDIPPEYTAIGMQLVFERYRRALNNHKEFSRELSDYDRSALWYSNLPVASAITVCKVILL